MNKQFKVVLKILLILLMVFILGGILNWGYKSIIKKANWKNTQSVDSVMSKK
jgi:hypothetical protein